VTLVRAGAAGSYVGLAVLTKVSAVGLLPSPAWPRCRKLAAPRSQDVPVDGNCAGRCGGAHRWCGLFATGSFTATRWASILCGDRRTPHPRPKPVATGGRVQGFDWSFWGLFGGLNVPLEAWTYTLLNAAGDDRWRGGWLYSFVRPCVPLGVSPLAILLLAFWPGVVFVALIRWTLMTQRRKAADVLCVVGPGSSLSLGCCSGPGTAAPTVQRLGTGILFLVAAMVPFRVIAPAYARGRRSRRRRCRIDSMLRSTRFSSWVTASTEFGLTGGQAVRHAVLAALRPVERDYSIFVHLLAVRTSCWLSATRTLAVA